MRNFVVRAVVGVAFVAVMVGAIVWRADSMILLFAIITGLSIWEFCGLVNQIDDVQTNRIISTVAGVYFFLAVAALQTGLASKDSLLGDVVMVRMGCADIDQVYVRVGQQFCIGAIGFLDAPLGCEGLRRFQLSGAYGVSLAGVQPV